METTYLTIIPFTPQHGERKKDLDWKIVDLTPLWQLLSKESEMKELGIVLAESMNIKFVNENGYTLVYELVEDYGFRCYQCQDENYKFLIDKYGYGIHSDTYNCERETVESIFKAVSIFVNCRIPKIYSTLKGAIFEEGPDWFHSPENYDPKNFRKELK